MKYSTLKCSTTTLTMELQYLHKVLFKGWYDFYHGHFRPCFCFYLTTCICTNPFCLLLSFNPIYYNTSWKKCNPSHMKQTTALNKFFLCGFNCSIKMKCLAITLKSFNKNRGKFIFTVWWLVNQWLMQYACMGNQFNYYENPKTALYTTPTKHYWSKPYVECHEKNNMKQLIKFLISYIYIFKQ